jgi:predicted Fe-Mo cluster-binding NifX family protein
MVKVAVAQYGEMIAPCFEAARHFLVVSIENNECAGRRSVPCVGCEGYRRVRLLHLHKAGVLICNGIERFYRDMLVSSGVTVIPGVSGPIDMALERYCRGELHAVEPDTAGPVVGEEIPHEVLVCWTRDLFQCHGYEVASGPQDETVLIDLLAEIQCPVCLRPVKVAICCGAHTYRPDQEIRQFHHTSPAGYDARVYIHPGSPAIANCCREYGIELITPDSEFSDQDALERGRLPILRQPVAGHEAASWKDEEK